MRNNYDAIAGSYDRVSRLVFGKSIMESQKVLLQYIHAHSRVLIVGGGTGWILEEIAVLNSSGLVIDYVEISAKMIFLASKRQCGANKVNFINKPIEDYNATASYDVIITPFLFDNFAQDRAEKVFNKLNSVLMESGKWLFTDFHIGAGQAFWQKALLRSMYTFFGLISHVEARQLPELTPIFSSAGYEIIFESYHFGKFIRSVAYRKFSPTQLFSFQK